jgi:hypothetical protein
MPAPSHKVNLALVYNCHLIYWRLDTYQQELLIPQNAQAEEVLMYIRPKPSRHLLVPVLRAAGNGRVPDLVHGHRYPVAFPAEVINLSDPVLTLRAVLPRE